MQTLLNLLGATISGTYAFLQPVVNAISDLLPPALIIVATAGSIYAVYLGVIMAKAEDQGKRDEAKKRVINAVLALVVIVVLILLLNIFVNNLSNWIGVDASSAATK